MYECFHCLTKSVIWDADFTFEDYGLEGEDDLEDLRIEVHHDDE